jgi:hypothetical protein
MAAFVFRGASRPRGPRAAPAVCSVGRVRRRAAPRFIRSAPLAALAFFALVEVISALEGDRLRGEGDRGRRQRRAKKSMARYWSGLSGLAGPRASVRRLLRFGRAPCSPRSGRPGKTPRIPAVFVGPAPSLPAPLSVKRYKAIRPRLAAARGPGARRPGAAGSLTAMPSFGGVGRALVLWPVSRIARRRLGRTSG